MKLRMSSPELNDADREAVLEVVNTPNLSMGPKIDAFEQAFCDLTGLKHAIGVNSGTAGLHLCVRASGIEPGDLVVTTPFSFVASTNVILFEKAIPVFVDIDPITGNIDPDLLEKAVEDLNRGGEAARKWLPRKVPAFNAGKIGSVKALLPVDVFGQPADYDRIKKVAGHYDLTVIEDSCEALGGKYKGKPAGTFGNYGVFAFYPNKQITTGEGGMIVTDDDEAADFMRALRNQGRAVGDTWLQHTHLGYNYRMDEMSAALGLSQIGRLEQLLPPLAGGGLVRSAFGWNRRSDPAAIGSEYHPGLLVRLCHPGFSQDRPGPLCENSDRKGCSRPALFCADPSPALYDGNVWHSTGRLPRHGRPRRPQPGAAFLRRDDRRGSGGRLPAHFRGADCRA